jgi:hypothetical protein
MLDNGPVVTNDGTGVATFQNVAPGTHVVIESQTAGWNLTGIAPTNGVVTVNAGTNCAIVAFRNQQAAVVPPVTNSVNPFVIQTSIPVTVVNNNNVNANANSNQTVNSNPVVNVQSNPVAGSNAQQYQQGIFYAQAYTQDTKKIQYIALLPPTGVSSFTAALTGAQGMLSPMASSPLSSLVAIVSTMGIGAGGWLGRKFFGA